MMLKKPTSHLRLRAANRPAGYVDDVLSYAEDIGPEWYFISQENWDLMVAKYAGTGPKRETVPVMPCSGCGKPAVAPKDAMGQLAMIEGELGGL